jgi:EAL domain-containing protein (putative c-di-GMP-specific phosphodiesterase class I)
LASYLFYFFKSQDIETEENYQEFLDMECECVEGYSITRQMSAKEQIVWRSNYRKSDTSRLE